MANAILSVSDRRAILRGKIARSRFLVPNAVTVGSMFCGFLALTYSAAGQFKEAALAILFAILLDGLDGRVARRLNATSRFGLEFDSFSDLVSFGVHLQFLSTTGALRCSCRPMSLGFSLRLFMRYALHVGLLDSTWKLRL